ncbi:MAG: fluoride efflux transporter CrcB [Euryarchaeota archaeon]|nr:fluoride efflux transporter CrcB [Euryarchaeota archaeon]
MSSLSSSKKYQAPPVLARVMHPAVLVGVGGAIGSVARWGVSEAMPTGGASEVPWATITVNLFGAFVLGALMAGTLQTETLLLFGTGMLGGFTTMSTFGVETVRLIESGNPSTALIYIALNLLAPLAAWLGWRISEAVLA